MRSRLARRAVTAVAVAVVMLVGLSATSYAKGGNGNPMQVFVTNTATDPVPVAGEVSVGNLPANQQVSGTVDVGNLPATQQVTGAVDVSGTVDVGSVAGPVSTRADHGNTTPTRIGFCYPADTCVLGQPSEWTVPAGHDLVIQMITGSAVLRDAPSGPPTAGFNGVLQVDHPLSDFQGSNIYVPFEGRGEYASHGSMPTELRVGPGWTLRHIAIPARTEATVSRLEVLGYLIPSGR